VLIDAGYSPNAREEVKHRPPVARFFNTVALNGAVQGQGRRGYGRPPARLLGIPGLPATALRFA